MLGCATIILTHITCSPYDVYKISSFEFDVTSDPVRWEAMKRVRDTGTPVATGRPKLTQEADKRFGVVVYLPIYRIGAFGSKCVLP